MNLAECYSFMASGMAVGYHGKALIRDITFELPKGQILTLIGPNGAGKSTILKTITRQLSPVAGTIYLGQQNIHALSGDALARQMSVLLTERIHPEMMTCFDVAAMGRYPFTGRFGRLSSRDRELVHTTLSRVGADDLADRDFLEISDGQRQRILLARALCQEPEVLVLDEPTSFLDIRYKIDLLDILLEETRRRQLTVILSLHEIDLAEKISDLVLCVKGDHIWRFGPPEAIFRDEIISELYSLNHGTYLTRRGSVELSRPEGTPSIFVIGGGGYGIPHYRALARKRVAFAAGILFENDLETDLARTLAARIITVPAFTGIMDEVWQDAWQMIQNCCAVLDAGTPIGSLNLTNSRLLQAAEKSGKRVVRHIHELD